jgi:dimethylamine monooxygenase subunit A
MEVAEILTDREYGFQMRFTRGDIAAFFRPGNNHREIISQRRECISDNPSRCLAILPEGIPLLDETIALGLSLGTFPDLTENHFNQPAPLSRARQLGEAWESDILLMKADDTGIFRMVGGCLCFPSHWDLQDKMRKSMFDIHKPVPTLNENLGTPIDRFLERIKPGISWERFNWGLSRTPDLNQHPSRNLPRLDPLINLDDVWWRLEEQSLVALPASNGILFGIKLRVLPLHEIKQNPSARLGMIQALKTMPDSIASYKGITPARSRLIELMEHD